jgi:2-methylcitrate dehydratase PrpD
MAGRPDHLNALLAPILNRLLEVNMLARIRKSVVAGLGAGAAAGIGALTTAGALTEDEVSKALGVALVAAAGTAWVTWRVPNAETAGQ